MRLFVAFFLFLTVSQPLLAVRSSAEVHAAQRRCSNAQANYHYEMDILDSDGQSNTTLAVELIVGGEEPRLLMYKNARWAATGSEQDQEVRWTPYYSDGSLREQAMEIKLRNDVAYIKHIDQEVETPNGTVAIDGIEIMSNDGRTMGFEGGIYFSDELMLRALRENDDGKYLLRRGIDVYDPQGLSSDTQFYKARPCAGLIVGLGLLAGAGMAIGWGFIGGYVLHLNAAAGPIVGLVFSTIGMGVGTALLVTAIGFGIAALVYQHANKRKYSATRHMWSELQCVNGLALCRGGSSLVPDGGDCDVPGPKRCCCTADEPGTCRIFPTSSLKSSKHLFHRGQLVCPSSEGYRHFKRFNFDGIPSACVNVSSTN